MKQEYMGYYNKDTQEIIITKKIPNYIGGGYVLISKKTIERLVKEITEKEKPN